MTRDELIDMATQSGFSVTHTSNLGVELYLSNPKDLERFAQLVAEAKCKELAEELRKMPLNDTANSIAIWIENEML